jgi:hypothetical protein
MNKPKDEKFCDNPACPAHQSMAYSDTLSFKVRSRVATVKRLKTPSGAHICTQCKKTHEFVAKVMGDEG